MSRFERLSVTIHTSLNFKLHSMQKHLLLLLLVAVSWCGYSQHSLSGTVTTPQNQPLEGAHIHIAQQQGISSPQGYYEITGISTGSHRLVVSYIGYKEFDTIVNISAGLIVNITLQPEEIVLDAVAVSSTQKGSPVNKEVVNQQYIKQEFTGSLAASLTKLPGVNATDIGPGASKPIIRGLGLNRLAVTENGLKHEGQQWGADHGLEIDALQAERIEIIKGAGTIEYGSDAMAGVIAIKNDALPLEDTFSGRATAFARTVNNTIGSSVEIKQRKKQLFYKLRATLSEFGDYNIPADEITYLTVKMPVYNNRLKNTAGREANFAVQAGFADNNFETILSISSFYNKTGFFPGAHGIPSTARVQDDGNSRNIELPFQKAQHYKVNSTSKWIFKKSDLSFIAGFQNNSRQEWSAFHTHYGNQQPPDNNPDLELDFNLSTFDAQLKYTHHFLNKHKTTTGLQQQWQNNSISGFSFLLPQYTRSSYGAYVHHSYEPSEKWSLSAGLRFDNATIDIERFYDDVLYDYLTGKGVTENEAQNYSVRSAGFSKNFSNFNAMMGAWYRPAEHWELSLSTGTSFRLPTAIELSSNGIHHGSFRHERGNTALNPEKGYIIDLKSTYTNNGWTISLSPYLYYFTNYIFLNPTNTFSLLPHAGQVYQYEQSAALLTGAELNMEKTFYEKLRLNVILEYLYNRQVTGNSSQNYPLPFSPPVNAYAEAGFLFNKLPGINNTEFFINTKMAAQQERIAQGEEITPGYIIFGGGLRGNLKLWNVNTTVNLTAHNIFNTRYFNHTSFYRALEIPEMGRNIQLMISIPFGNNE